MTDPADLMEARLNANHADERVRALATIQSMRRRLLQLQERGGAANGRNFPATD